MGKLPACSKDRQYTLVFISVEADPSKTKEEVKAKLQALLRAEKPRDYAIAYEKSVRGYRHAHLVVRFERPRRVLALCKHLAHEMRFTKVNGSATSVRAFAPRRGGESWTDMLSYITDKKHKVGEVCDDAVTIVKAVEIGLCMVCGWRAPGRTRGDAFLNSLMHGCLGANGLSAISLWGERIPLGDRPGVDQ